MNAVTNLDRSLRRLLRRRTEWQADIGARVRSFRGIRAGTNGRDLAVGLADLFRSCRIRGLDPELPQVVVQMLIHQRRPFHRSEWPKKEVRMRRASPGPAPYKAVYRFTESLPLHHEVP